MNDIPAAIKRDTTPFYFLSPPSDAMGVGEAKALMDHEHANNESEGEDSI